MGEARESGDRLSHKLLIGTVRSRLGSGPTAVAICALALVLGVVCSLAVGAVGGRTARDSNPLDLPVAPTNGNPLSGARFFVDHEDAVSLAARQYPPLRVISEEPGTARFGAFHFPIPRLRWLCRAIPSLTGGERCAGTSATRKAAIRQERRP